MLQEGPDSPAAAALGRIVDDLLWSLHPPAHPASRNRLVKLLPGLIGRLRASMAQTRGIACRAAGRAGRTRGPRTAPCSGPLPDAPEETPRGNRARLREGSSRPTTKAPARFRQFGARPVDAGHGAGRVDACRRRHPLPTANATNATGARAVAACARRAGAPAAVGHGTARSCCGAAPTRNCCAFADDAGSPTPHAAPRTAASVKGWRCSTHRDRWSSAIEVLVQSAQSVPR